jgi:thioredoxin-related protein
LLAEVLVVVLDLQDLQVVLVEDKEVLVVVELLQITHQELLVKVIKVGQDLQEMMMQQVVVVEQEQLDLME